MTTFFQAYYLQFYSLIKVYIVYWCDEGSRRWLSDEEFIWDDWRDWREWCQSIFTTLMYHSASSVSLSRKLEWSVTWSNPAADSQLMPGLCFSGEKISKQNNSGWKLPREKNTRNGWNKIRGWEGRQNYVIFSNWSQTRTRSFPPGWWGATRTVSTRW